VFEKDEERIHHCGDQLSPEKHFMKEIVMKILAKKTGFYTSPDGSNLFALPAQIIGNSSGEEVYFQTDSNSSSIRQMGTLSDWQEYVAKPVSGNPILIFSLAVSFQQFPISRHALFLGGMRESVFVNFLEQSHDGTNGWPRSMASHRHIAC
jgi:hypothetical protein